MQTRIRPFASVSSTCPFTFKRASRRISKRSSSSSSNTSSLENTTSASSTTMGKKKVGRTLSSPALSFSQAASPRMAPSKSPPFVSSYVSAEIEKPKEKTIVDGVLEQASPNPLPYNATRKAPKSPSPSSSSSIPSSVSSYAIRVQ